MNIENQLMTEISNQLTELGKQGFGSDEYKATVDGVTKLIDRALEMQKLDNDILQHELDRDKDIEFKKKELKSENIDRVVKNIIALVGIGVPAAVAVWGTFKTIEFEKEGIVSTFAGRAFFGKLFKK